MCGGTQSPYLRAEVNNNSMTEENGIPLHERDSREEAQGDEKLAHNEFICAEAQDYIARDTTSVLMHMRSVHGTEGGIDELVEDIEAESQYYRNVTLPSAKTTEKDDIEFEIVEDQEDESEPSVFQKFLSTVTLGIYDPN